MEIRFDNINFCQKYPTGRILEITSKKIFEPDGVTGYIETLKQVHGNVPRYTGHQGYRRYADEIGEKIMNKYPDIAAATKEIIEISKNVRSPYTKDLRKAVQPVLNRFDKEIDIIV